MIESPSLTAPTSALIVGCGYVGLRTARLWQARGIATFAITRDAAKAEKLQTEGIRPLVLNLGSTDEWRALPDVDIVLWSVGFDRRPGASRKATWIDGLQRLLGALPSRIQSRRIIYTSSTGVYGDGDGQDVDELTPTNPASSGGAACIAAERILQGFAGDTGTHVSILRLAGIYGPDRLLRRVSELRDQVPLTTQPDEWLNLIHVDDAVRVIDFFGTTGSRPEWGESAEGAAEMMNVVSAGSVTRRIYYSTLAKLVSAPEPIFSPSSASHRNRGGNRRIHSRIRPNLPIEYKFDDCAIGLADAVARSSDLVQVGHF